MKRHGMTALLCAAYAFASAPAVLAQGGGQQPAQGGASAQGQEQGAQDSQCLNQLQTLAERMQEDGYWLSGYRGYGTAVAPSPSAARGVAPTTPRPVEPTGEFAVTPDASDTTGDVPGGSPWRGVTWEQRPQYEIGVLYEAAHVLARSGNEEICGTLLQATEERYGNYVAQLNELGVRPEDVTTWRQAEIAASEPVSESEGRFRIEEIVGTNVRNAEDQDLGSVEDVMLDPRTGQVQYVIINHGGLFGIGGEQVVVPWDRLRVTQGMNAFVLPVEGVTLEQAPALSGQGVFDIGQTGSINTDEVDSYWNEAMPE